MFGRSPWLWDAGLAALICIAAWSLGDSYVQAVVAGANNEQLFNNMKPQPVMLLDAAGNEVRPITATSGVTVPKQQLNPTTYQNTRVHYQWARPATAATYRLRISGNGAAHVITLRIPVP